MRPLSLRLIGFRSYADATIDFRHHRLVVISGDTGAGKTSILDGVSFALFGRTPELGGSKELLTLGATHGEVALTFVAGGRTWRVTRRYGRGAPEPAHLLEQLEGDEVVDRAIGATTVNEHVIELIGMTFQAFTSAVLLAQGRFAQFLQSPPKERDAILRELFGVTGLESVRTAAIATRDGHRAAADALDRERARLGELNAAQRHARARAVRTAAATHAAIRALLPLVDAHTAANDTARACATSTAQITAALDELPDEATRTAVIDEHRGLLRTLEDARERHSDAQRSLRDAQAASDGLRARHGGTATELASLRAHAERAAIALEALPKERAEHAARAGELAARREELQRLRGRLGIVTTARETREAIADALARALATRAVVAESGEQLAAARAARASAQQAARAATEQASVADEAMDELRHAHLTAELRRELHPGKPCPVCGQTVYTPPPPPTEDLSDVEAGVASLNVRAEDLAQALARAEATVRAAELHDATARTAAADAMAMLRAVGGAVADDQSALKTLRAELGALEREYGELQPQVEQRNAEIEREAGSIEEAARRLERDQSEVANLAQHLGPWADNADPLVALTEAVRELELLERSVLQSSRYVAQAGDHATAAEQALHLFERQRLAPLRQSLTVIATRLGAPPPGTELAPDDLLREAATLVGDAQARAQQASADASTATELAGEAEAAIAALGEPVGVAGPDDVPRRLRSVSTAVRAAGDDLARIEQTASEIGRLRRDADGERRRGELYATVAVDLQANRFPRFLLSRFHERLAHGATARLIALSHGAFSFTGEEPDHLAVVDHRRGHRVRSAATLSGGERFLASLALALALADIASGAEGRLECLFLDEGFSSLDADSLELAISGVERMADDGRLVVIITHLPGVAERLGAAIHVRKDPGGASHIVDLTASQ